MSCVCVGLNLLKLLPGPKVKVSRVIRMYKLRQKHARAAPFSFLWKKGVVLGGIELPLPCCIFEFLMHTYFSSSLVRDLLLPSVLARGN